MTDPDHLPIAPDAAADRLPRHIAIIMDGNGRWAQQRGRPRGVGHRAGGQAARKMIEWVWNAGVPHLTLFAFSTENWERPGKEVKLLMDLFLRTLKRDMHELHKNDVRVQFIGDHGRFGAELLAEMARAESETRSNAGLRLNIAVGYGGRQDLVEAMRALAKDVAAGRLAPVQIDASRLAAGLALHDQPEPDLLIRTGGESRISNFLLWQMAYTELYFTQTLWPDFDAQQLNQALSWFANRDRRFGRVAELPEAARA